MDHDSHPKFLKLWLHLVHYTHMKGESQGALSFVQNNTSTSVWSLWPTTHSSYGLTFYYFISGGVPTPYTVQQNSIFLPTPYTGQQNSISLQTPYTGQQNSICLPHSQHLTPYLVNLPRSKQNSISLLSLPIINTLLG